MLSIFQMNFLEKWQKGSEGGEVGDKRRVAFSKYLEQKKCIFLDEIFYFGRRGLKLQFFSALSLNICIFKTNFQVLEKFLR